jgi:L-amino acid N-acyltransferase YncA
MPSRVRVPARPGNAFAGNVAAVRIRDATVEDADAIALVHVRGWQAAYRGRMPQEYLDALDVDARAAGWGRWLAQPAPGRHVVVLEAPTGAVVGFAGIGPTRDSDADPALVGEIASIYVHPDHWGRGGGRLLMAEAVRRLARDRLREATLWVLDANDRARRFYEATGWRIDGARKTDESLGFPLDEVRYRRPLP